MLSDFISQQQNSFKIDYEINKYRREGESGRKLSDQNPAIL